MNKELQARTKADGSTTDAQLPSANLAQNHLLAADYTGYFDDNGNPIYVGQKLKSEWNYEIIVCKSGDGSFYGQLVCDDSHSCKNIPYALNDGMGHTICG